MKKLILSWCLLFAVAVVAAPTPVYNASNPINLASGTVVQVWSIETPTPGNGTTAASQQVTLFCGVNKTGCPFGVDGKFSGAPGVFEVDVQVASTDSDTSYQTVANGNITTVDATNNTFHFDGSLTTAKFARLLMRSRANSVTITATFTGG